MQRAILITAVIGLILALYAFYTERKLAENKKYKAIYVFNRPQTVSGVTNATEDNMGVLFIDYDNCDYEVVLEDLNFLARRFKLPPSYVFMTKKNNYHVINLKKFPNGDIPKLLRWTRCDHNYVNSPSLHLYRSYVLRLSSKVSPNSVPFKFFLVSLIIDKLLSRFASSPSLRYPFFIKA